MSIAIAAVLIGALAFSTVVLTAFALGGRRVDVVKRLGIQDREGFSGVPWQPHGRRRESASGALVKTVALPSRDSERLNVKLRQAGIRRPDARVLFAGVQIALPVALFIAFSVQGYFGFSPILCGIVSVLAGGFLIPYQWLNRAVFKRKEKIRMGLADALDLTVICVEAG